MILHPHFTFFFFYVFFYIINNEISDGGQLGEDSLSTVDSTLLLSLVWEEAQQNQPVTEKEKRWLEGIRLIAAVRLVTGRESSVCFHNYSVDGADILIQCEGGAHN